MTRSLMIGLTLAGLAISAGAGAPGNDTKEKPMTARGTFEVKVLPQPADAAAGGLFGRFVVDKQLHGDLEGTGKGEMLAIGGPATGTGAYVALEMVTGTLHGKRGSFVFQHRGTMSGTDYHMDVTVVPGSGTDELSGIAGAMTIIIEGSKHSYVFEYTLGGQ